MQVDIICRHKYYKSTRYIVIVQDLCYSFSDLGTATPSHAKTANYAEMPEVSKKKELDVPKVAICPATPQVWLI